MRFNKEVLLHIADYREEYADLVERYGYHLEADIYTSKTSGKRRASVRFREDRFYPYNPEVYFGENSIISDWCEFSIQTTSYGAMNTAEYEYLTQSMQDALEMVGRIEQKLKEAGYEI